MTRSQVTSEVLNHKAGDSLNQSTLYYLVESKVLPESPEEFKQQIQDGETFDSEFIGASPDDCRAWAKENQCKVNFIEHDVIAIVDARSAEDKTIIMSCFVRETMYDEDEPFPPWGTLPRAEDVNTWFDYRIEYSFGFTVRVYWNMHGSDLTYPAFFGKKEDFTDENGVFDVAKAQKFSLEYDPDLYTSPPPRL
ncbi:hypothetical protein EIK77_002233 [Talaromyces pinophilus]|nr:hypothetical protein EIK77_002233 [Talaromyces pinophilus]